MCTTLSKPLKVVILRYSFRLFLSMKVGIGQSSGNILATLRRGTMGAFGFAGRGRGPGPGPMD